MAARAQVHQVCSTYSPTVSVGASYARNRSSQSRGPASSLSSANPNSNVFNLPFDVSWEPDLWGRVRNTVHQFSRAAQVSAADLENVKLTEQANLAVFYFQLRGQDALEDLYQETVDVDQKSLDLTHVLYKSGLDNDEAVGKAGSGVESAKAAATNAGIARAQYGEAIAALLGVAAATVSWPGKAMRTHI